MSPDEVRHTIINQGYAWVISASEDRVYLATVIPHEFEIGLDGLYRVILTDTARVRVGIDAFATERAAIKAAIDIQKSYMLSAENTINRLSQRLEELNDDVTH